MCEKNNSHVKKKSAELAKMRILRRGGGENIIMNFYVAGGSANVSGAVQGKKNG